FKRNGMNTFCKLYTYKLPAVPIITKGIKTIQLIATSFNNFKAICPFRPYLNRFSIYQHLKLSDLGPTNIKKSEHASFKRKAKSFFRLSGLHYIRKPFFIFRKSNSISIFFLPSIR